MTFFNNKIYLITYIAFIQGDYVWLPPKVGEFEVPIGGKVVHHDGSRVKILDDEGGVSFLV